MGREVITRLRKYQSKIKEDIIRLNHCVDEEKKDPLIPNSTSKMNCLLTERVAYNNSLITLYEIFPEITQSVMSKTLSL